MRYDLHVNMFTSYPSFWASKANALFYSYIRELTQRVETLERERKQGPRDDDSPASPAPPIPSQDVAFFGLADLQGSPSGYPQTGIKRALSLAADEGASRVGIPPEARNLTMAPALLSRSLYLSDILVTYTHMFVSYYTYLHPFLPFMLADSEELNQLLSQGPSASARAFIQAFELCMNATQYTGQHAPNIQQFSRHVYDIYNNCKWEDPTNILQLYTALLLVVESINRGASTYLSRAGQDPWMYFRELVSVAITSNVFYEAMQASTQDEHGYRRLALCMSVLDTFLAFANRKEGFAIVDCDWATYTRPEDQAAYGRKLFELNRITRVIRKLQEVQIQEQNNAVVEPDAQAPLVTGTKPVIKLGPQDTAMIIAFKNSQTELLQSIQLTCNYNDDPVIGMSVWYARILIELHYWPQTAASALLYSLRRLIETFQQVSVPSLWTAHFAGLAAHTLSQLCDFSDTKDEAGALLDLLADHLADIVPPVDADSFDAAVRAAADRKRQSLRSANLEHLAAVAVGKSDGDGASAEASAAEAAAKAAAAVALAGGAAEFSGAKMSREGYFTALLT